MTAARDADECQTMITAARANGVLLMEGSKWRYDPQHLLVGGGQTGCGKVVFPLPGTGKGTMQEGVPDPLATSGMTP